MRMEGLMIQMLVRQVAAAVVALVLVAGPARAADPIPPERQKLIVEMVEAAGMMRMIDNMLPAVMAEFERAFRAKSHKVETSGKPDFCVLTAFFG
jgi:predicted secreted protein